jgi:hypothetical protein
MPVILPGELEADWLAPEPSKEHALSLLGPYSAAAMMATPASQLVNPVRNDEPACLRQTRSRPDSFDQVGGRSGERIFVQRTHIWSRRAPHCGL